jgi:hypothetical protein
MLKIEIDQWKLELSDDDLSTRVFYFAIKHLLQKADTTGNLRADVAREIFWLIAPHCREHIKSEARKL